MNRHSESKLGNQGSANTGCCVTWIAWERERRAGVTTEDGGTLITKDILPSTTRSANTDDHSLTYPQRFKIE